MANCPGFAAAQEKGLTIFKKREETIDMFAKFCVAVPWHTIMSLEAVYTAFQKRVSSKNGLSTLSQTLLT